MKMKLKKKLLGLAALLFISSYSVGALAGEFYEARGVAIKGFDPVAYFTDNKAVRGNESYSATYKGSKFLFASKEHQNIFEKDPSKYAPQFAGYCAFGVSKGAKAKIEGESFKIVDGKLYLNYDSYVQKTWKSDQAHLITKAEKNWPTVSQQKKVVQ